MHACLHAWLMTCMGTFMDTYKHAGGHAALLACISACSMHAGKFACLFYVRKRCLQGLAHTTCLCGGLDACKASLAPFRFLCIPLNPGFAGSDLTRDSYSTHPCEHQSTGPSSSPARQLASQTAIGMHGCMPKAHCWSCSFRLQSIDPALSPRSNATPGLSLCGHHA